MLALKFVFDVTLEHRSNHEKVGSQTSLSLACSYDSAGSWTRLNRAKCLSEFAIAGYGDAADIAAQCLLRMKRGVAKLPKLLGAEMGPSIALNAADQNLTVVVDLH